MANNDDAVQHGIDDNPNDDAKKGLELGALGGGTVGAIAGSLLGPVGTIVGALIGGSVGSVASGAAVQVVDAVDNDNTVSGIGDGASSGDGMTAGVGDSLRTDIPASGYASGPLRTDTTESVTGHGDYESGSYAGGTDAPIGGHNVVTGGEAQTDAGKSGLTTGAVVGGLLGTAVGGPVGAVVGGTLGSLAGGVAGDATEAVDETTGTRGTTMNNTNITPGTAYGHYEGRDISRDEYNALDDTARLKVRLLEEELHVDKAERQVGEVEISKRIITEQVEVPVTLEREEIVIHRSAATGVSGDVSASDITDQTIVVPVREEFAQVTKTAHVAEEVEIERHVISEEKTISDTVRREELDITDNVQGRVRIEGEGNNSL